MTCHRFARVTPGPAHQTEHNVLRPEPALTDSGRPPEGDDVYVYANHRSEVPLEPPHIRAQPERRTPVATIRRIRVVRRGPLTVRITTTTTTAVVRRIPRCR